MPFRVAVAVAAAVLVLPSGRALLLGLGENWNAVGPFSPIGSDAPIFSDRTGDLLRLAGGFELRFGDAGPTPGPVPVPVPSPLAAVEVEFEFEWWELMVSRCLSG